MLSCFSLETSMAQGGFIRTYQLKFNDRNDTNYFPNYIIGMNVRDSLLFSFFKSADTTRKLPYGTGFGVFDLDGNLLNYRSIPYTGDLNYFFPEGMEGSDGGNFYTSVHFSDSIEAILKYNPYTREVDTFTIRNSVCDSCSVRFGAMTMDPKGSLMLIHNIANPTEFNPVYSSVQVTKMDTSGKIVWQKVIGGGPLNPFRPGIGKPVHRMLNIGKSIYVSNDGHYYIGVGYMNKYFYYQTYLYKLNESGEIVKEYLSTPQKKSGVIYAIKELSDGKILLSTEGCDNPDGRYDFFSQSTPFINIMDKNLILIKSFQVACYDSGYHDLFYNKIVESNNKDGVVLMGNFTADIHYKKYDASLEDSVLITSFTDRINLLKMNYYGDSLWHRIYKIREAEVTHWSDAEKTNAYDLKSLPDGSGYLIGGYSYRDNALEKLGEPYYVPLLIKVDNQGCIIPDCHLVNGVKPENEKGPFFKSWPNPFNDVLVIQQEEDVELRYFIYDTGGRLIDYFTSNQLGENMIFNTLSWSPGTYIIEVFDHKGRRKTEPVVKN